MRILVRVQNNPCNGIVMLMIHMLIAVKEQRVWDGKKEMVL